MAPATLKKLQKELKAVIEATPYEIEIALQDGGHRYVARIFWPYKEYPALLWDRPEQEIHSIEHGRMCIEWELCAVGETTYADLNSGDDYWGNMRDGLAQYIKWLREDQEPYCAGCAGAPIMGTYQIQGYEVLERVAKPFGNGAYLQIPKCDLGKRFKAVRVDP